FHKGEYREAGKRRPGWPPYPFASVNSRLTGTLERERQSLSIARKPTRYRADLLRLNQRQLRHPLQIDHHLKAAINLKERRDLFAWQDLEEVRHVFDA